MILMEGTGKPITEKDQLQALVVDENRKVTEQQRDEMIALLTEMAALQKLFVLRFETDFEKNPEDEGAMEVWRQESRKHEQLLNMASDVRWSKDGKIAISEDKRLNGERYNLLREMCDLQEAILRKFSKNGDLVTSMPGYEAVWNEEHRKLELIRMMMRQLRWCSVGGIG